MNAQFITAPAGPCRRGAAWRPHGRDAHIRRDRFGLDRLGDRGRRHSVIDRAGPPLLDEYAPDRTAFPHWPWRAF
jgi:hypothetical protein